MPCDYRILPEHGLVYLRHWGHASVEDTLETLGRFSKDPGARPDQRHLVDLSGVESHDEDHVRVFRMHAQVVDVIGATGPELLLVLYAPTDPALRMARLILNVWEASPVILPRLVTEEAAALDLLGIRAEGFAQLLVPAG